MTMFEMESVTKRALLKTVVGQKTLSMCRMFLVWEVSASELTQCLALILIQLFMCFTSLIVISSCSQNKLSSIILSMIPIIGQYEQ